jgi:hypothetical protein
LIKIQYECVDLKAATKGFFETLASSLGIFMKNKKVMDESNATDSAI